MPTVDFLLQTAWSRVSLYVDKSQFEWTGGKRDQFLLRRFIAKGILPASVYFSFFHPMRWLLGCAVSLDFE